MRTAIACNSASVSAIMWHMILRPNRARMSSTKTATVRKNPLPAIARRRQVRRITAHEEEATFAEHAVLQDDGRDAPALPLGWVAFEKRTQMAPCAPADPPNARRGPACSCLPADSRRLDRQPLGAPGKIKLNRHQFGASCLERLSTHALEAGAKPPAQRAQRLPLQAIGGEAVGMALADPFGAETLAPVLLVALRTRDIELPLVLVIEPPANFEGGPHRPTDVNVYRQPARLVGHERGQR